MRLSIYVSAFILCTTLGCAQITKPGVDRSPFGAQSVWPNDANLVTVLNRMQEAGIQWGRFDLIWWSLCERTAGQYEFVSPNYPGYENWNVDRAIALMKERNIEPFPILCYSNPLYDNEQGPYSDTGRAAFAAYCHAAAARYKDSVTYWEIWNEPNQQFFWGRAPNAADYAKLAIVAAPRIREGNPNAIVVGGVTSGIDLTYLQTAIDNGLLDAVDAITVHPYRTTSPESIASEIASLRSMIAAKTSRNIPVWTGEWGYNTCWSNVSNTGQAKCLARMMVNNLSTDINLSIWFCTAAYAEDTACPSDPQWGLLDFSYAPRPSWYAMQTLNKHFAPPVKHTTPPANTSLTPANSTNRIEFFERANNPKRMTCAVWRSRWPTSDSYAGVLSTLTMTLTSGSTLKAYDGLTGAEIPLTAAWNGSQVTLTSLRIYDYPIYIDIEPPPPTGLFVR